MNKLEDKIQHFISKRRVAFLGSIDSEGYPNIKCMLFPRKVEGLTTFYFSTNTSSMRVAQFQNNSKAAIYFCSTTFFKGVMLRGNIEVTQDQKLRDMLWEKGDTKYYPLGVSDPDYSVLILRVKKDEIARVYRID